VNLFKPPVTVLLPASATDKWKEMYGPRPASDKKAKDLAAAFNDDEEDDDDDEGDDEEPDEFPDDIPDEEP
jgi:hypothetical protein